MNRQDIIRTVVETVDDETIIVSNIGDASFELFMIGDRPRNFYMLGSFGLASSIAFGLAISQKDRVVALNGDGALLFNLGSLATEGRYKPDNLLHIVVDNGAHGATGYQPTATSICTDLAGIAASCGLGARTVGDCASFKKALEEALRAKGPQVIVAKVDERPQVQAPVLPHSGREICQRFMKALQA